MSGRGTAGIKLGSRRSERIKAVKTGSQEQIQEQEMSSLSRSRSPDDEGQDRSRKRKSAEAKSGRVQGVVELSGMRDCLQEQDIQDCDEQFRQKFLKIKNAVNPVL